MTWGGTEDTVLNVLLLQIINKQFGEGMTKPQPSRTRTIGIH